MAHCHARQDLRPDRRDQPSRPRWRSTPRPRRSRPPGRPVIGFGAGEPDFPTPDYIVEAGAARLRRARFHQYTPAAGLPELREAIAAKTARDSGLAVDAEPGAGHQRRQAGGLRGLRHAAGPGRRGAAAGAVLDHIPGVDPRWPAACPVRVHTDETTGYRVTVEQLEAHCTDRDQGAAVRLAVQPDRRRLPAGAGRRDRPLGRRARPLGASPTRSTSTWSTATPGSSSMPVVVPEIADRCVVLNGVAKTYAMTGWRVGWMIGPADVVKAATNLQSHATSNVCNVAQAAALAAVSGDLSAVAQMRAAFDRRRQVMTAMLNDVPGVVCPLPEGAFYCYPSVKGVLGKQIARAAAGHARPSWPSCCWTRPTWRSCPARRSAPPATSGCRARSATPIWRKASRGWPSCWARPASRPHQPTAAAQPDWHTGGWPGRSPRCRRRTCTCTSPARCGTAPWSNWPAEHGVAPARGAGRTNGRRS